ncbi:MAG: GGDEF domain-containing protein [Burkholderiales bacterium]|nr:GGDEF domain-containing protein [Burkholderiales bacterium]
MTEASPSSAQHRLAELEAQIRRAQVELDALRREAARERGAPARSLEADLREANEHLVVAALRSQAAADQSRAALDALALASQRDPLTGLPTRALLLDRLGGAMAAACRHGSRLALVFLDIDGFKQVNDTHGHAAGDAALRDVARRLEREVRTMDTVSRHGGDEFLLLLTELATAADAARVAAKILAGLVEPGCYADATLRLSASMGIAIYPDDANTGADLIALADAAMYRAKEAGGRRFEFHAGGDRGPDSTPSVR